MGSESKPGRIWSWWRKISSILDDEIPRPGRPDDAPQTETPSATHIEKPASATRANFRPKPTAYDAVMKRALEEDAAAQYLLALWHFQDQVKNASKEAGLEWLAKAAQHGHADARKLLASVEQPVTPKYPSWISPSVIRPAVDGERKPRLRTSFEFATVKCDRSAKGQKLYELGQVKASECISAALDRIARKSLLAEPAVMARELAERRGLLSVGSDRGMAGFVDGSDPFFDQYRAAFIQGVEDGLAELP